MNEKYSLEKAQEEAEMLRKKVESGEASSYIGAEKQLEQKEIELSQEQEKILSTVLVEIFKERSRELVEKVARDNYDCLIFLDNSARPISWMFQEAWKKYFPGRKTPAIRFINIGLEKNRLITLHEAEIRREDYDSEDKFRAANDKRWSKIDSQEYIEKLRHSFDKIFKDSETRSVLFIDDYIFSGFTSSLVKNFFKHHFPEVASDVHRFLKEEDFPKAGWNMDTYLPWSTDRAYTLLKEDDEHPERVLSQPERDPIARQKGLALKREITDIFINEKPIETNRNK